MTNYQDYFPLILLLSWDEKTGPVFLDSYPLLKQDEGIKLGIQIFMIASSIFGTDDYSKEVVDVPIANLGFRARIWTNYKDDGNVRGGKLPFMLAVTYSNPKYKTILSNGDDIFSEVLNHYCSESESKINLFVLREYMLENELLHFSTLEEFYQIISSLATSSYFGLAAGTIISAPIVDTVNLDEYFSILPSTIPQGVVSQVLIKELQEYWYVYWIGPFTFMFQPPIHDMSIFQMFIKGLHGSVEKLWNLIRKDPNSKVDMVNILTKVTLNPELIFQLYQQSLLTASHKLSGKELTTIDRFQNSDVFFYIQSQAQRLTKNNFQAKKVPELLDSYKKLILTPYFEGFLIVFGFFLGKELFSAEREDNMQKFKFKLEEVIRKIYTNNSKWKIHTNKRTKFEIKECPFCKFSKKCNFVRGILLSVFGKDILEIEYKNESIKFLYLR
ncbi:MAG: hypothetical protein HeimC3_38900 [Candidatus Heimdallarchaeota archaeon LC_3]|nr:MAG: hypothetical protein HeimC3_38900 [Candidatus Heimdallarchaeota archaeon LC_3]